MEKEIPAGWSRTAWNNYECSWLLLPETPNDGVFFYASIERPHLSSPSASAMLKEAIKCGDLDKVKALVEAGAPTSEHDIFGCESPLILAVSGGHLEIVEILLANGADTWSRGSKHGRTDARRCILLRWWHDHSNPEGSNAVVLRATEDASRAVYFACYNGHYEIVLLLLAYGVDERFCRRDGNTLLHHWTLHHMAKKAIENGETSDVAKLLACDAANPFGKENKPRIVPICVAAMRGDLEMVRELSHMEKGEVFSCDAEISPLSCAAGRGHLDVVKFLVNAGRDWSDPRKASVASVALIAAAENDHVDVLAFLISRGIDVDAEKSGTGETALFAATRRSKTRAMKLLLEHGASVHARLRENGATCLYVTAEEYNWETTRLLVAHGADLNARDNTLSTPLNVAARVVDKATGKLRFQTKRGAAYYCNLEQLERRRYEGYS